MWVVKLKIDGTNALFGSIAKKSGARVTGYPLSSKESLEGLTVYFSGFLFGSERTKRKFMTLLRKHPRVLGVKNEGDFIIGQIKESRKHSSVYNHNLIYLEPAVVLENGTEFWTVGSYKKQDVLNFITATEKSPGAEVLKIYQKKVSSFSIVSIQPELTKKQKISIEIAMKYGYYNYPRKVKLEKLARLSGISYSTFQAHLRKAEQKVIPFFYNQGQICGETSKYGK